MDVKELASMGGKARAKSLGKQRTREIAAKALKARWDKYRAKATPQPQSATGV